MIVTWPLTCFFPRPAPNPMSCGQFMLRKEDKYLMKRKDKTVAACSHVICFFFGFFIYVDFFQNLSHQVFKKFVQNWRLCHQFSAENTTPHRAYDISTYYIYAILSIPTYSFRCILNSINEYVDILALI